MPASPDAASSARRLADELLFARALDVDPGGAPPREQLDALAEAGLYGIAAREDVSFEAMLDTVAAVASGCLSTALVWLQHHGVVRNVAASPLAGEWLEPLTSGRVRASVGGAALRPKPPAVDARLDGETWTVDGFLPWMTGAGLTDVVLLACREGEDIVWLLVDADALQTTPLAMVALGATGTVSVRLDGLRVPADRFVRRAAYADVTDGDGSGLVINGALALGVAQRCCALMDDGALDARVADARKALLAAPGDLERVAAARAETSVLALDASARLIAASGSRGVLADGHPARLAREALVTLSFAQRPPIRAALMQRLS